MPHHALAHAFTMKISFTSTFVYANKTFNIIVLFSISERKDCQTRFSKSKEHEDCHKTADIRLNFACINDIPKEWIQQQAVVGQDKEETCQQKEEEVRHDIVLKLCFGLILLDGPTVGYCWHTIQHDTM